MIVLHVKFQGRPGTGDELERNFREIAPLSREEEGCALYIVCRSRDDSDLFLLHEHYLDEAAHAAHRETPHFQRIVEGQIAPLLESREREFYTLVDG